MYPLPVLDPARFEKKLCSAGSDLSETPQYENLTENIIQNKVIKLILKKMIYSRECVFR